MSTSQKVELQQENMAWEPQIDILRTMVTITNYKYNAFCESFETWALHPKLEYAEKAVQHGNVNAHLKNERRTKRVYMVTGVQISKGHYRWSRQEAVEFSLLARIWQGTYVK